MNDKQLQWAFYMCVIVIAICVAWDVVFMKIVEWRVEDKLYQLQADVNGLKGLIGLK